MKKVFLTFALMIGMIASYSQTISVQGGNVTYMKKNLGFSQVEVSGHITKDIQAVGSYSKVLGGYDISTVGLRHATWKDNLGISVSGAYIQNGKFEPVFGLDFKISEQVRLAFTSSFNNRLRLIGLKVPVYRFHK